MHRAFPPCACTQNRHGSYNLMTCTGRATRGADRLGLKLLAIRYARANGARSMRTHNDSQNAPCWRSTASWATSRFQGST